MNAIETATGALQPAPAAGPVVDAASQAPAPDAKPTAEEVTSWLLDGRFFTVGTNGGVTSWSQSAADTFGWHRADIVGKPFLDVLVAEAARAEQHAKLAAVLSGAAVGADFTGDVDALDAEGGSLRAAFAMVPIELGVGYEFNALLQEILTRARDAGSVAEVKARHESVMSMIEAALEGRSERGSQGSTLAGALVVFRAGPGSGGGGSGGGGAASGARPGNVVPISESPGLEEMRTQLERARHEAEDARVAIRNVEDQLEEARREIQRTRAESDASRQEAEDARDALAVAQRGAEEARRVAGEAREAAEAARIRADGAQNETDALRAQLREARDSVRGMAGRADDELAQAQERAAHAMRELADARAEVARHEAEVAPLRERFQAAQRELGALRADLESARAAATERETVGERRAGEVERLRSELETRAGEVAAASASTADVSAQRDRIRAAFECAPVAGALIAPDGRFLAVSDSFCRMLGHPRERLLTAEPPAIVHPDDLAGHREQARRMLAGELRGARSERRYVHADGHAIPLHESVSLARDSDGRSAMFVVQLEEAQWGEQVEGVVVDAELESGDRPGEATATVAADDGPTGEAMRRALEEDLFQLHCQPVLDLHTNAIVQHELLIRMTGEDGRMLLPQAFLGPARRAGLAHAIDRWVVRKAIRLLHETAITGSDVSLEVNLSPEAVHDLELPAMIDEELAATPIDPARLVLEVTGATAAEHLEETRTLAKRLRGLGCRFALDDFRSNFGSFRLLRDLPLDFLKLDGELVGSLTESRTSQLIVKALVDVAAGTGMKTVAVFVSDDQTLGLLRQSGVDYAQGYKVGRPRPVADVLESTPRLPAG